MCTYASHDVTLSDHSRCLSGRVIHRFDAISAWTQCHSRPNPETHVETREQLTDGRAGDQTSAETSETRRTLQSERSFSSAVSFQVNEPDR